MAYKPRKDIKVSESYIQKLRDAGSKKAALEKYGSSSDPKMREALRRFYGASAPAPMKDSSRTVARTLPKKSIPMKTVAQSKPSRTGAGMAPRSGTATKSTKPTSNETVTMGSRTGGKITVNKAANEKRKAEFEKRTNRALTVASLIPAVRAGRAVATGAKVASGVSKVKGTAKYYGDAAKNMSTRAQKAGEMRSTQQAVAAASKKKASGLQGAATRAKNAKAAEKARLERNAKAAATRAANKKAAAKRAGKAGK
jgi:hypothetical protein